MQLRIVSDRLKAETLEDALLAAGSASVTLEDNADQPILEPALGETPLWNNVRITGLFPADVDTQQTLSLIEQQYSQPLPTYSWEILEDKDWEREWMTNFHPMRFGQRLWICPSWKEPPSPDDINLFLDPGLAFGTGTHPTTALCLEWLDSANLQNKRVIDYGCGSGILGIAALLLGAKSVVAIDNDPQALIATIDNAKRNNIDLNCITTCLPEQTPDNTQADVIVANILAGPLAELAPHISSLTTAGGTLALSGIISSQANQLNAHYQQWFDMEAPRFDQDWGLLSGTKR